MKAFVLFLLLFTSFITADTMKYYAKVDIIWSNETHPHANFPNGPESWNKPHMTAIIGAVHNDDVHLWQEGGIATNGMKAVAEIGSSEEMSDEISQFIYSGAAKEQVSDDGSPAPGEQYFVFTASDDFDKISFASMIAPTPDWFIGVDALELKKDGKWLDSIVVELHAYDAGTKEGTTYSYSFPQTEPREPIRSLQNISPFSDKPLAILTLVRERTTALLQPNVPQLSSVETLGLVDNQIIMQLKRAGRYNVGLFTLQGRSLFFKDEYFGKGGTVLPIAENIAPGIHLVKLWNESGVYAKKVVQR